MKRIYLYLVVLLGIFVFNASPALAQEDYVISGTVLDEYEKPLPGATVRAIGLDKAVTTDKDGKYQIVVPKNTKLEVSFVGFVTKTTNGGRVKLKATTTSVGGVEVVSKKKQDLKKVKFVDSKAMISAVDTLLKRMPTAPPAGYYDTAVVHSYIKNEVYERFKKNPEVMTGVANAYFRYEGERSNWTVIQDGKKITYPDTFLIKTTICEDSLHAYRYIDYAIAADSTYAKAYELGGNIHRDKGRYLEAMKWYRRGMKNAPKSPDNYLAFAKLVINNDTASALRTMREFEKVDSLYPVNLELARMYYDMDELGRAYNYFERGFWLDSLERKHFTENDLLLYLASSRFVYNARIQKVLDDMDKGSKRDSIAKNANFLTRQYYRVASYGLNLYPEHVGFIREAFYLAQRLEMNDTAKFYAEKLFAMPNVKLITDDYLTYAKLYAAMGDFPSADKKYSEAFDMCLTQIDEIEKESKNVESDLKIKRLTRQRTNLKNSEDIIVNEHTRLYSENYERKISIAQYYINKKKGFGRTDYIEELNQLGAALAVKAQAVDSTDMVDVWKQVDAVYAEMAELKPDTRRVAIAVNYRLQVIQNIDLLTGETTGLEFTKSIIDANKDIAMTLTGLSRNNMITAYQYQLIYYYNAWQRSSPVKSRRNKDYLKILDQYSTDLLILDTNNRIANTVLRNIY